MPSSRGFGTVLLALGARAVGLERLSRATWSCHWETVAWWTIQVRCTRLVPAKSSVMLSKGSLMQLADVWTGSCDTGPDVCAGLDQA